MNTENQTQCCLLGIIFKEFVMTWALYSVVCKLWFEIVLSECLQFSSKMLLEVTVTMPFLPEAKPKNDMQKGS